MNRMLRWMWALSLALAAPAVPAETLELNLSDRALRGEFAGPLAQLFPRISGLYSLGALLGERDDERLTQGHFGVLATGDAGARQANVTAGLGGRAAVVDIHELTGGALALGGMIEARLPAFNRIGVIGYAYGAPKAATFGDLDGYLEYAVTLDYQVIRNASLFAGYRQLKLNPEFGTEFAADNGWHGGLRLNF